MDKLLAKLSEQQAVLTQQNEALKSEDENYSLRAPGHASSSNSLPVTPATDAFPSTAPTTRPASATLEVDAEEVLRLKMQLAHAQSQISRLDQELAETRTIKTEQDPIGTCPSRGSIPTPREGIWATPDDTQSEASDAMSTNTFNRSRGIWGNPKASSYGNTVIPAPGVEPSPANWFGGRGINQNCGESNGPYPTGDGYRSERLSPESDIYMRQGGGRRVNRYDSRVNSPHQFSGAYGGYNGPPGQYDAMMGGNVPGGPMSPGPMNHAQGMGPMGMGMYPQHQQQPAGTSLSPYASEFTSSTGWKGEVSTLLTHLHRSIKV